MRLKKPSGMEYLPSLAAARRYADSIVELTAWEGGKTLLRCPVTHVQTSETRLVRLLAGLSSIVATGFEPLASPEEDSIRYYRASVADRVHGTTTSFAGSLRDDLELFERFDALLLRPQIEAVLGDQVEQFSLVRGFPNVQISSLAEAQRYPQSVMWFLASFRGRIVFMECPTRMIGISESELERVHHALHRHFVREYPQRGDIGGVPAMDMNAGCVAFLPWARRTRFWISEIVAEEFDQSLIRDVLTGARPVGDVAS